MDINITKTKEYYNAITDDALCNCSYCHSYRLQVKSAYSRIAAYLDSFGVNIEKPFETSPLEPDENGMLAYCGCQYIVFGTCESEYCYRIDDVEIRVATSYPSTGIDQ